MTGNTLQITPFMHVRDLCYAVLHVLPRLDSIPARLNVGPGVDHTVNEYYEAAARVVGWQGEFVHDLSKPVGMRRKLLDVTKLAATGFRTRIGLEEGLEDTYRWLRGSRPELKDAA